MSCLVQSSSLGLLRLLPVWSIINRCWLQPQSPEPRNTSCYLLATEVFPLSLLWASFREIGPTHSFGAIQVLRLKRFSKICLFFFFLIDLRSKSLLVFFVLFFEVAVFVHQMYGSLTQCCIGDGIGLLSWPGVRVWMG